jgi:hypothetical protein
MGIKRPSEFILTLEDNDIASQSESDAESDNNVRNTSKKNKKRKIDDLNPDFEFDGYGVLGGVKVIDDDGWGFTGIPGTKESAGVDLEGIIARRREKNSDEASEEEADDSEATFDDEEDQEEAEEEANSDEVEEFTGIEDDLGITSIINVLHFS